MKNLEVEETETALVSRPDHKRVLPKKKDNMFVAIAFMNLYAIFSVSQGSIFKYVSTTYSFDVIEYFFLRCLSMFLWTLLYIKIMKIEVFEFPDSKTK
jgi:hypothetical protein